MSRVGIGVVSALAAWTWMATLGAIPAFGQVRIGGRLIRPGSSGEAGSRVQLVMDRTASRGMKRAQESIAAGEYSQAVAFLDNMLGRDEDLFVELADDRVAGLKETARQLIRDLPPEGRQAYEAAYGAAAARMLEAAVEGGDASALERVAQRYFYTPAGYEAAFLLAMDEADAGRHYAAALNYQQLLESPEAIQRFDPQLSIRAAASWLAAGEDERARSVLENLVQHGRQTVVIAGREHRLDESGDPLEWLRETVGEPIDNAPRRQRQWLTFRGNAARNGVTSGGLPHMRVRWKVRLLGPPQLESLFENFLSDFTRSGAIVPVASNLLAAGDYILTRTPHGLLAVDFRTGKRVWRSEPQREEQLERLIQTTAASEEDAGNPEPARSFARRMWEDYLYGLTSSDGSRVYTIRDLPMPAAQDFDVSPFMGGPIVDEREQSNKLSAYELATQGKLVWEIDGAAAEGDLAGAFFLGAPLQVGESLYVLAEVKGGVYVIALDRATGQFQWRQELARLETGVLFDVRRRLNAAIASYEGGILVCPTGAGVVVGVDLAKRSLAWAYRYEATSPTDGVYRGRHDDGSLGLGRRWVDAGAAIAEELVLLTPPESNRLHCLDLRTGKMLWRQNRGDMTRLACIEGNRVLLVGNRKVRALRLEDGKPAWKKNSLELPQGVAPSGTGFLSEDKYFLPLTSAEVIAIDLAEGRIVSRAQARDGQPLGNLICHRGAVISQSGIYLDCFDQIEVLKKRSERRLAKEPNNVEALRTLGEVAYNEGRLSDAISMLEQAYRRAPDDIEARDVLAECLAAALDEDFAAHQSRLPLLKELQDGGLARRMLILRIEAQGLLQEGDPIASAAACLELYRLAGPADELMEVGSNHRAAVSRWVQAQFAAAWEKADDKQRQALDEQLQAEIEKLGEKPQGDELARFLEFFGGLPATESLKLARARELHEADQWLDAQQILLDLEHSENQAVSGEAIARISAQLHEPKVALHTLASEHDGRLRGPLADVKCLNGLTGHELAEKWAAEDGKSPAHWPRGKVEVRVTPAGGAGGGSRIRAQMWGVRLERTDSILGLASAQFGGRGELVLQDNYGREFFTANLESEVHYGERSSIYGVSRGNLLVVSLGRQLAAFNTLATPEGLTPPILWRVNIGSLHVDRDDYGGSSRTYTNRPGSYRAPRTMYEDKWVGVIGPVTSRGVVFQDQRRLVCVDAASGEVRWSRTDVPQGCDLFGDDRHVFAVETGSTTARIYSAIDGRRCGKSQVPEWRQQLVTRGRNVVSWKVAGNRAELSSLDALTGETQWRHEFESGAAVDIEMGRFVAVVEASGRAVIVDAQDGKFMVDQEIARKPTIDEIHLRVGHDTFLIAVKHPRLKSAERQVVPFNPFDAPVLDGQIFLFDRTSGDMRWRRPAEVAQQALLLTQPVDLPFLLFAGALRSSDGTQQSSTALILDKATGRTLHYADDLRQAGGGHCVARVVDAASRQAAVEMAGQTILLQFTGGRRPPEPPAMVEVESGARKAAGGIMGIFQKFSR